MNKKEKYLAKIENDVNERIFDILMIHLLNVKKIIIKKDDNYYKLIKILDNALKILKKGINNHNRLNFYRYMILICNIILYYDTHRQDIKDIKKKIIEEFTHSENVEGKIPLNYQINELRITYDTSYLREYLIKRLIERKEFDKALYCLIAVRLIEPDDEKLDEYYRIIKQNISDPFIDYKKFRNPVNKKLLLDSNIVIGLIDFKLGKEYCLDSFLKNNDLVITSSVYREVKEHIDFVLACSRRKEGFNEFKELIDSRFKEVFERFKVIDVKIEGIDDIKQFYSNPSLTVC
jgi:hypothetical protein